MKTLLALSLTLAAAAPAQAQMFRPDVGRRGGHHSPPRGAVHHVHHGAPHGLYVYRHHAPVVHYRYRPTFAVYGGYGYYPAYGMDYPYYQTWERSAAADGFWLGALAGGIVGHNSGTFGHNGWRGAAWGAAAGWLLGSVVDANRRAVGPSAPVAVAPAAPTLATAPPATAAAPVTIINNYYGSSSPLSDANRLFGR
ncbi:MAG: hypothetical protein FJ399_16620 [Verrucomicrobia bacterium]|nr:hypothetical protein [Verrucomicrobiota bacterium]